MTAPLEIHFHGLEKSDAVEAKVRDKFNKLQRHFERMSACRVVLEAPHRNSAKAKVFQVKIEISVPGQKPIIVNHEREGGSPQDDLGLVIRDAFEAATRRIDDLSTRLSNRSRTERQRRRPASNGAADR
jgi:ribosome-associated translation inhibitor RaiA